MNSFEIFIKLLLAIILVASIVILSFSLFRIPIKGKDKVITVLALVLGSTNFYLKNVLQTPAHYLYFIFFFVVMLVVIRRYPILYALLVAGFGSIAAALIDNGISYLVLGTNLATLDQIKNSFLYFAPLNLVVSTIYLGIAYIMVKFKLGRFFVISKFGDHTKLYNYVIAIGLLVGIFYVQFTISKSKLFSLHGYLFIIFLIYLIAMIIYTYNRSMKDLKSVQRIINGDEYKSKNSLKK